MVIGTDVQVFLRTLRSSMSPAFDPTLIQVILRTATFSRIFDQHTGLTPSNLGMIVSAGQCIFHGHIAGCIRQRIQERHRHWLVFRLRALGSCELELRAYAVDYLRSSGT